MGLFRKEKGDARDVAPALNVGQPVDLARLDRLVANSQKLRELGVAYEVIEQRAVAESITFNDALEAVYREQFRV